MNGSMGVARVARVRSLVLLLAGLGAVPRAGRACECTISADVPGGVEVCVPFTVHITSSTGGICENIRYRFYPSTPGFGQDVWGDSFTHTYTAPGTYHWWLGLAANSPPVYYCSTEGSITVSESGCSVFCDGVVPATGRRFQGVEARAVANASGCPSGEFSYVWDWGDGDYSWDAEPVHYYQQTGTYTWTLWVYPLGACAECSDTGTITITEKPHVTSLDARIGVSGAPPMRVDVRGDGFTVGMVPEFSFANGVADGALAVGNVQVIDSTRILAELTVGVGAALGPRDLRVRSGDQTTDPLPGAMEVIAARLEINQGAVEVAPLFPVANHATVIRGFLAGASDLTPRLGEFTGLLYVFKDGIAIGGAPFLPSVPVPEHDVTGATMFRQTLAVRPAYEPADRRYLRNSLNYYFGLEGRPPRLSDGEHSFWLALSATNPGAAPPQVPGLTEEMLAARTDFIRIPLGAPQEFVSPGPLNLLLVVDNRLSPAQALRALATHDSSLRYLRAAYPIDGSMFASSAIFDRDKKVIDIDAMAPFINVGVAYSQNVTKMLAVSLRRLNEAARIAGGRVYDRIALLTTGDHAATILGADNGYAYPDGGAVIVREYPATLAHELGHTYGLGDNYCGWCGTSAFLAQCYVQGVNCRRPDAIVAQTRPGAGDDSGNRVEEGAVRLVPLIRYGQGNAVIPLIGASASVFTGNVNDPAPALGFYQRIALMGTVSGDNDRWPDFAEWKHLMGALGGPLPASAARSAAGADVDSIAVYGIIDIDDLMTLTDVVRGPALAGEPQVGDYSLDLIGAGGEVLTSAAFAVGFVVPDRGLASQTPFAASVPVAGEPRSLRIRRGDRVLATRGLSSGAPTVAILAPTPGQVVTDTVTIRWTGTDPDGDALEYSVHYLADGIDPVPIATRLAETSLTWNRWGYAGGAGARILVIASDGLNTGHAFSGAFTVAKSGPTVTILAPEAGAAFPADRPVTLTGTGWDPDDGALPEASLTFHSSIDGELGSGSTLERVLSAGVHTLRLRGADRDGNAAEETITIAIGAAPSVPVLERVEPPQGAPGAQIRLVGRALAPGTASVRLGDVPVGIVGGTDTELFLTVPDGSEPGPTSFRVLAGGFASPAVEFTVIAGRPRLLELEPARGTPGTPVLLTVREMPLDAATEVLFGGVAAPIVGGHSEQLAVVVPEGLPLGDTPVLVNGATGASDPLPFQVEAGAPGGPVAISAVVPGAAVPGKLVEIRGRGFSASPERNTVAFGERAAVPEQAGESSLTVRVPVDMADGAVHVVVWVNGYPSNAYAFTVGVPAPTTWELASRAAAGGL